MNPDRGSTHWQVHLVNFFTAGPDEVKAWTIRKGFKAVAHCQSLSCFQDILVCWYSVHMSRRHALSDILKVHGHCDTVCFLNSVLFFHIDWFVDLFGFNLFTDDDTSSTAQGVDGSFKDRKPIGDFGCCDSLDAWVYPLMNQKVQHYLVVSIYQITSV